LRGRFVGPAEAEDFACGLEAEADALGGGAGLGGVFVFLILWLSQALGEVEHDLVDGAERVALGLLEFGCELGREVAGGDV
jgi:hypothetical protein